MKNKESVTNYMATKLIKFKPQTSIQEAMQTIVKNKISGAPVVDNDGKLVGLISEKDCLNCILGGRYSHRPNTLDTVGDFMSSKVKTISEDSSTLDAALLFVQSPYRRFPVVDGMGKLVGQISRRDILKAVLDSNVSVKKTVPDTWKTRLPNA